MKDGWHYAEDGAQRGPVDWDAIAALARQGRLTTDTLVWHDGMAQWEPAGRRLPQLFQPVQSTRPVRAEPIAPERPLEYERPEMNAEMAPARLVDLMRAIRPWARFCGLFLLLGAAICGVVALLLLIAIASKPEEGAVVGCIFFAGLTGMTFPAGLAMNRFASRAAAASNTSRIVDLEIALDSQRGIWRLSGILLIVGFAFMIVFLTVAAIAGSTH